MQEFWEKGLFLGLFQVFVLLVPITYFTLQGLKRQFQAKRSFIILLGLYLLFLGISLEITEGIADLRKVAIVGADGSWHIFFKSGLGSLLGFVLVGWGTAKEIRFRRQAEEEMKRREALRNAILTHIPEGVIVVNSENCIEWLNPMGEELLGAKGSEALGKPLSDYLPSQKGNLLLFGGDLSDVGKGLFVREVGQRVLNIQFKPIKEENGEILGTLSAVHDITALAKLDQVRTEFVSTVSHELRTPLTSIKGYVDLILDGEAGELSHDQEEYLEVVQSNTDRLVALINNVLDISHLESGIARLDKTVLTAQEVIDEVKTSLGNQMQEKHQELKIELPREPLRFIGDRLRVVQVLTNLLSNACKYTPEKGKITISVAERDKMAQFSISDTGIGIPFSEQSKIFAKFFRVRDTTRHPQGTGLGLAIAKSIVEMHGGKIWFESKVGKGSTFTFTLPTMLYATEHGERLPLPSSTAAPPTEAANNAH
ncbi:MAG: PAS domain-containing protein [Chloroflexi bacterium]|nr:PAS domain-containing protein [Chloroflexota bacterium]